MRKLENIANTDPPDSDYLKGRIRNKTGSQDGTPVIEQLYGDIVEAIHKLAAISGITENDLPDNETNSHQVLEAFGKSLNSVDDFKYENLLLQEIKKDTDDINLVGLATLNETDFAIALTDSSNNSYLKTYRFNGSSFEVIGSIFDLGGSQFVRDIATLNSTDIALLITGIGGELLKTYRFDGVNWALVGSELSLGSSTTNRYTITGISSTDIALAISNNTPNEVLKTYRFNGSTWSTVGNPFSLPTAGESFSIKTLYDNAICLVGDGVDTIQKYVFDGVDWAAVGSATSIPGGSGTYARIGALGKNDIIFIDENINTLVMYRFDGTDWNKLNFSYDLTVSGDLKITELTSGIIIIADSNDNLISLFRTLILK